MKKITVLIPCYDEEVSLRPLFKRLDKIASDHRKYEWEFLFINDGSKDKTLEIITGEAGRDSRISYVGFARNFGKEIAIAAGLDYATGDAVAIIDADLQDPPELIPEMIKWWEKGYDDVYARRRSRPEEGWLKRVTSKLYYRLTQKLTHIEIQPDTGDFRLFSRRCVEALKTVRDRERQSKAIFSWVGFRKKEILYDRAAPNRKSRFNYRGLIKLALDGMTMFTTAPLRIATIIGFIVTLVAFVYIIVIIAQFAGGLDRPSGFTTTLAAILFLGGIQLLILGIIGEYIARIFIETKHQPLYVVEEYHNGVEPKKNRD